MKNIVINDYDYTIFAFWDSVLNQTEELIRLIERTDVSIDEWHIQKAVRANVRNHSRVEVAFSTFFLNRTNRSGIIDKAGPIGGFSQTGNYPIDCRFNKSRLINQIQKIASLREHIKIYNLEAINFIDEVILKTRNSFVFFDPPYYGKGPGLYTNFYSHEDHLKLANEIQERLKNRKWIVTYDNVEAIKMMYAKAANIEFELQYSLQRKCQGSEILFFSKKTERPENECDYVKILR